jgi:hypothetical protein
MRYLTLARTLVYYDGPQVVLGHDGRGTSYLAVGVPSLDDGAPLFLAVAVAEGKLDDYFSEVVDLRHIFRRPKGDRYFTFSLEENRGGRFALAEREAVDEEWLPAAGFFASQHTEPNSDAGAAGMQVTVIPIDGRWDMQDLATFPNKYADAYAFMFAVTREDASSDVSGSQDHFAELFQRYPWRGGYSTVSFYNDLYREIPRQQRLKIREIRYASPGVIRIEASALLTDSIRVMVLQINENWSVIREAYRELHSSLSERSFLGASRYEIEPSPGDKAVVREGCRVLSKAIGFQNLQRIYKLCDDDWISAAKILLSFFRRIEELAAFYDSGKASFAPTTAGGDVK